MILFFYSGSKIPDQGKHAHKNSMTGRSLPVSEKKEGENGRRGEGERKRGEMV